MLLCHCERQHSGSREWAGTCVKEEAHGESAFITVGCALQKTHNKDIHPFPGGSSSQHADAGD